MATLYTVKIVCTIVHWYQVLRGSRLNQENVIEIGGIYWTPPEARDFLKYPNLCCKDLQNVLLGLLRKLRKQKPEFAVEVAQHVLANSENVYCRKIVSVAEDILNQLEASERKINRQAA